jgi:hypothetical protein
MTFATLTKKIAFTASTVAAVGFVATAPANALSFGDIQITGYQSSNPDSFSFVTWVDIPVGTGLTFTDNGFNGTAWRTTENVTNWSNTTANVIPAGTVINITGNTSGNTAGAGADLGTGSSPAFSTNGDQIFIVDGTFTPTNLFTSGNINGNLLFGFDYNGAAGWSDTGANANSSALPSLLSPANGNFAFAVATGSTGIEYTGPRTGKTIAEYRALLADVANWTPLTANSSGGVSGGVTSTDFTIDNTAIPTPAMLPGLVGLGMGLLRKRKSEEA